MKVVSRIGPGLSACLVGVLAFLVVVGPRTLNPANVDWVMGWDDPAMSYLSWVFFRHGPWTMPIGLNPNFGLELSSSILYGDAVPLLAFLFKSLSRWLPNTFQYVGLWLAACFVLQALFAWMLMGLVTPTRRLRLVGCALFAFAPPMLDRLIGHWALVGHWVILAALVLALQPGRRGQVAKWAVLVAIVALVNAYLLAMVIAIWCAAWIADLIFRRRRPLALALEVCVVSFSCLVVLWQAGFFSVGEGKSQGGYGLYGMNLNALINPAGWSRVLPTLPWKQVGNEGFSYLGLGVLLAAGVALHAASRLRARGQISLRREWWPLGLVLLGLTVFAVSNHVKYGLHEVIYPIPWRLELWFGSLRSSARFFWPPFYVLLFGLIALIVRAYPARVSFAILCAALAVQVVDTSPGWAANRTRFLTRSAVRSPLTSGFWFEAPALYRRVRMVPPGNHPDNWIVFADYAQRHSMATDAVYLARMDRTRRAAVADDVRARLAEGTYDRQAFYVLQDGTARIVPCSLDPERDQLAWVDGFWVLMPDWKLRFGDRYAGRLHLNCPVLSAESDPMAFVEGTDSRSTLSLGWAAPEAWGTWSEGPRSLLILRLRGPVSELEFTAAPVTRPGGPLIVNVSVDGQPTCTWQLAVNAPRVYTVPLSLGPDGMRERVVRIGFAYSDFRSPTALGNSPDPRQIALGLRQVRAVR
jgi:hypothetical protein